MRPARGYLAFTLHAHLPYVRHPEHPFFIEELWYYEAVIETYLPLLRAMEGWERDSIYWRLTMSVTPPLLSMFRDPLLCERFEARLGKLEELIAKELVRTKDRPEFLRSAEAQAEHLAECRRLWTRWQGRLDQAFRHYYDTGQLEIITCGATHGFLPYLAPVPGSVRAQVEIAARAHEEAFGRRPQGIWLPECAYLPGNDRYLREAGIRFGFLDTHGLVNARPRPENGVYAPLVSQGGIAYFGRDLESSRQVWSKEVGYPGDPAYREFYRDVGYDLDWDYVKEYVHEKLGIRLNTGIKYHRVTGDVPLSKKDLYDPEIAAERARTHAWNFVYNRQGQVDWLAARMDRPPVVVSPYDAELYGHWWYEGPQFLDHMMRAMHQYPEQLAPTHPREYLERFPDNQKVEMTFSTWGAEGYGEVWLNTTNEWIYRHLHAAARRMSELAARNARATGETRRVLDQMGRELLLAQASDWAFIMNARTAVDYAIKRTRVHLHRFWKLSDGLASGQVDMELLAEYEAKDNLFPEVMDFELFA